MAGCQGCGGGETFPVEFTMAFQPIVDLRSQRVWGYEALVRGTGGEGAGHVLSRVTAENRYKFDQAARVKAIELAGRLLPDDGSLLSINFLPNAVYEPKACIGASLAAAKRVSLDHRRLMFEFTENEKMDDVAHVQHIVAEYRRMGFTTALDDFGAGYAGLGLLARFRPDLIKVDMELVRDIDRDPARQVIAAGLFAIAEALGIRILAEGIETEAESRVLLAIGITVQQGYYFAKPAVETLPPVTRLRPAVALAA